MKHANERSLRTSLILLIVLAMLVTLGTAGSLILFVRLPQVTKTNQNVAAYQAKELATRMDVLLDGLEARVHMVSRIIPGGYRITSSTVLDNFANADEGLETLYVISPEGKIVFTGVSEEKQIWRVNIFFADLTVNPLYQAALSSGKPVWSDNYASALTGIQTIAVAVPFGQQIVIAEIPMTYILKATRLSAGDPTLSAWLLNQRGEVLVDTEGELQDDRKALMNLPLIKAATQNAQLPTTFTYRGKDYHPAIANSSRMGWLFLARMPAGLDNQAYRSTLTDLGSLVVTSFVVALLLATWGASKMTHPVRALIDQAHDVAEGHAPEHWPRGSITELNQLSSDLESMATSLQTLNQTLEARVKQRTLELEQTNGELTRTLTDLRQTQTELVQAEKLAALGRLVAGVAHELNTPIGNGLMAASTMSEESREFEQRLQQGIRRSDLEMFIHDVVQAAEIASRNLERAAQLVNSFKQVAVDQTSSQRREFNLKSVIDEILLTLRPTFKRTPYQVTTEVPDNLNLDSYPGPLGQALTNLISNALQHGFEGLDYGTVSISAEQQAEGWVVIRVSDDGCGIPQELIEKVFTPFFTTRLGQGGSGLGLHIVHNVATRVLGGNVAIESANGQGTTFTLRIPQKAPELTRPAEG